VTPADWWNYAVTVAIGVIVVKLVFWLPLKALRIERDAAFKQMGKSWRRTWRRLGKIEAARKAAKKP
jgi:membrane-anchored glycerophosphoryl diester phosphodiesterase (GDPDase)